MQLPYHLLITVGTSLLNNLKYSEFGAKPTDKDLPAVQKFLSIQDSPLARICGAELNSTFQLLAQRRVQADCTLHFCVSDTEDGLLMGAILKQYCQSAGYRVMTHTIEGLQDQDPQRFGNEGLRNLVRICGKVIQEAGGPEQVALNATGGYKAQIAIAALIGAALQIPVYYKHELFDSVIAFPPMPIAIDEQLLSKHLNYLLQLEEPGSSLDYVPEDEALLNLLDMITEDGQSLCSLSPLGQICLTSFLQRHPPDKTLPRPATSEEHKATRLRDDHYPKGFAEFVEKIAKECPYVTQCVSLDYAGQASIRHARFYTRLNDAEVIVGEYQDKDDFGARFQIKTTAATARERDAVLIDLTRRYSPQK